MHIETVEIRNFRSLRAVRVDLQAGLNVVLGRNNSGKTNLLTAIRHSLGPSPSRGDTLWLDEDDFYRESARHEPQRTISVTLTFAGLSAAQRATSSRSCTSIFRKSPNPKPSCASRLPGPRGRATHRFNGREAR